MSADKEVAIRLEQLERRLEDVQGLVTRVYERQSGGVALLASAREHRDYASAWDDPEPLVSVRVATYRGANLLVERTLPSLLAQTHERWEALVVGDHTDDDTEERIATLGDSRITFENLPFRGPYPTDPGRRWYVAGTAPANRALELAGGQWIAALDHDDAWQSDHLERLLAHARETRAEVVYGRLRIRHDGDEPDGEMGAWPPVRGEFGWLGALMHAGLRVFRFDPQCQLSGEPGDWNLARRLWDIGARFSFLDEAVAIHHANPKPGALTGADAVVAELRAWTHELEEARDYWHAQAVGLQQRLDEMPTSREGNA
jgi:hypothetical protein